MIARAALTLLLVAALGACQRRGRDRDPAERFALGLIEAARSDGGIRAEQVDDELVEKARRLQLVRRTTLDTFKPDVLRKTLAGEAGPDQQYPVAERPTKQRERATRGLRAGLTGRCAAQNDPKTLAERLTYLTKHIDHVPPEVAVAQDELRRALDGASGVAVACEQGIVGMILVPRAGGLRVVDLFAIGLPYEVDYRSPGMK